jgi:hypothetical protein
MIHGKTFILSKKMIKKWKKKKKKKKKKKHNKNFDIEWDNLESH